MGYNFRMMCVGFIIFVYVKGTTTLKNVHVKIPKAVVAGEDVVVHCYFDLEGAGLYSVKWYKKTAEFFRYVPMEKPPIRSFKIKGLRVLEERCNETQIVLKNVTKEAIGEYSCEVSADQPNFSTGVRTFVLKVVDLPCTDPQISGLKNRYDRGETINANCTSFGSDPAVNLTWYINSMSTNDTKTNFANRLTYSILRFNVTDIHFVNDKLKIRCSATMFDVYHKSYEKSVELKKAKPNKYKYDLENDSTNTVDPRYQWELVQTAQRSLDSSWIHMDAVSIVSKDIRIMCDVTLLMYMFSFYIIIVYLLKCI